TAEAAILGRPMVVTYHLPGPDRLLARLLVRSRFFSLPNLLAGEAVVPELLEPTVDSVVGSLRPLLGPGPARAAAMAGLGRAAARLGPRGAIAEVARLVLDAGRGPDS
ncbi:lipid-A-disaccharide synthase, partial [candidate division WOR-3 bacterium]|nr:lipid-A-disaccharide synthase [candidate division WOR-3 bacterium]